MFADNPVRDGAEVIGLDTPVRAQDTAVVPIGISVKLDPTPERHITKLYLIIDNNPSPVAVVLEFPGDRDWKNLLTRVRINAYTNVRILAELNDGGIYMTTNYVKASGGCSAPALKDPDAAAAQLGQIKLVVPHTDDSLLRLLIKSSEQFRTAVRSDCTPIYRLR